MKIRFKQEKDNTWVQPIRKGYMMQCCDCGLIHEMDFRLIGKKRKFIQFKAKRANKNTLKHNVCRLIKKEQISISRGCEILGVNMIKMRKIYKAFVYKKEEGDTR